MTRVIRWTLIVLLALAVWYVLLMAIQGNGEWVQW